MALAETNEEWNQKIHKESFKIFVRIWRSGIVYDFYIYGRAGSTGREKCDKECIVIRLAEVLPNNQYFRAFADYWFSTLSLLSNLTIMSILTTVIFRSNRTA